MNRGAAGSKRRRGLDRTRDVAQAALACFSDSGFRLTQIADVSARMGVSVGTIYRYVESKEALLHLATLEAVGRLPDTLALPVKIAAPGETAAILRTLVAEDPLWPVLRAATQGPPPADPQAEARAIAGELYDAISGRAALISLVDRCAQDLPELADVFDLMRRRVMAELVSWVRRRADAAGRPHSNTDALARGAMEAVAWLAKNRPRDRTATEITDGEARQAAVRIFANAFEPEDASTDG